MKRKKTAAFDVCNNVFMVVLLVVIIYPLYFTVIASFSEGYAVAGGNVIFMPVDFTAKAYQHVFAYKQIWTGYVNSIYYTVLGTLFSLCLTIPAAYVLTKRYLPYKNVIMSLFLITMYFGGGMIPSYILIKNLGLINTRVVLIITSGVSVYNLIVTRTFFVTSISDSLYEAADIDGASEMRKFFSVAMPLAKPIIAVMGLYYAVGQWNSYFSALLYVNDKKLEPLQSVLRRVLIQNENALNEVLLRGETVDEAVLVDAVQRAYAAYTMKYAMVFIASAPLLVAYPFVQKYFVKGVMIGAVKE